MTTNDAFAATAALTDAALLTRLGELARNERCASAALITHLAELDGRPSVYAARGYGKLFSYCTGALRLSEDAAYNRIEAARAARRYPVILDLLAEGAVSLTAVRMLGRHLTEENHAAVLAEARGKSKRDVEVLVARLAPRPDLPPSVRRLPSSPVSEVSPARPFAAARASDIAPPALDTGRVESATEVRSVSVPATFLRTSRAVVQPTAPARYRVQFAIGQETYEKLRRLQDLLAREVPGGDPAILFDRAITELLARVEKAKGLAARPRRARSGTGAKPAPRAAPSIESVIVSDASSTGEHGRSRHVPAAVRSAVWRRDDGRCAFVAPGGRCAERRYLEFHHRRPFALGGEATPENTSLRCRLHNAYEARQVFGVGRGYDSAVIGPRAGRRR